MSQNPTASGATNDDPPQPSHAVEPAELRPPSRATLYALLLLVFAVVIVGGLLQLLVAENIPALTEVGLREAEDLWTAKGPTSYDMKIDIRGAQPGLVNIEVRDGIPTTMTRDDIAPPERTWDVWTVPGMFETLEREIVLAEDPQHEMDVAKGTRLQLRCEFNPTFGYPSHYHRYATEGAPEVFWRITEFHVK
jgi:hypothetical protein